MDVKRNFSDWCDRRYQKKVERRAVMAKKIANAKQRWAQIPAPINYFSIIGVFAVLAFMFQIFFWSAFVAGVIEPWIKAYDWNFEATWYTLRGFRNIPLLFIIIPALVCLWKGMTAPLDSANKSS